MSEQVITLEALEALVSALLEAEKADREKMFRTIAACARIVGLKEPKAFGRMPLVHGDEAGHWDNSFPPEQVYSDRSGPKLLEIIDYTTEDVATEGGYYHAWRRSTTDQGLFVAADGGLWGAEETGTGSVGQFAAHPGDTGVECEIEWRELDASEVETDRLKLAVAELSKRAFPLATAALAK